MCSSTAASAPTDSMTRHSSRTCGVGELGADRGPQQLGGHRVRLVGQFDRLGEQHRALAGAQIVARRLAGHRGVAEHAEHIVAQLERHPEVGADLVEDRLHVGPVGGGGRAELQRAGDGVGRGLVGVDVHRRRHAGRAAGLGDDVEILPAEHLGADVGPHPLNTSLRVRGQVGGRDDVVGPDQGEIAEQDRRRQPELVRPIRCQWRSRCGLGEQPVHRGQAAAGRRVVDHVVVHQRAGMQQLQRGEQTENRRLRPCHRDGRRPRASPSRRTRAAAACRRAARTPRALRSGRRSRRRCRRH